jgi:hypothetical protein
MIGQALQGRYQMHELMDAIDVLCREGWIYATDEEFNNFRINVEHGNGAVYSASPSAAQTSRAPAH